MQEVRKVATIPILGKTGVNFFCISSKVAQLYEDTNEFSRQKTIKHLGLISYVIEGATHSRYEYLMLQAGLTDLMDNLHKGSATAAQGSLVINGKKYSGNALLKAWFLLSNFGHCKNTIADEKSLLIFSNQQRGFKSNLVNAIKDEELKEWSAQVIKNFEYTKFHHILAIRNIYKKCPRKVDLQNELIEIYKLLLLDENMITAKINLAKLSQLKRIFNTIRALSIATIDGYYSHLPVSMDLIPTITSIDTNESTYHGNFLLETIEPFLNNLHESIYLDKEVLAYQRHYEIGSLAFLTGLPKRSVHYENVLCKAFDEGLVDVKECALKHFTRLSITKSMQTDSSFYDEYRRVQTIKRGCSNCVEAILDVNPITGVRYADFFINSHEFKYDILPKFTFNIAKLIQEQVRYLIRNSRSEFDGLLKDVRDSLETNEIDNAVIETAIDAADSSVSKHVFNLFKRDIYPSFKELLWSILKLFLRPNYEIDIDTNKSYDIFGLKFPEADIGFLELNIKKAISAESHDSDRVHELEQLRKSANRKFDGFVFICLARVTIYNKAKPPSEKLVTDIDSVVIKISETDFIIELNESKNMKKNRENFAKKELRKLLVPVLNVKGIGYKVRDVKGFGAKLVINVKK